MQKLSKRLACLALGALCTGAAWAQSSGNTLEQAIEMARATKSGELGLRTNVRADSTPASAPQPVRASVAVEPKIWRITGVERDLTVEVVYEGKVYPLSLAKNQVRVGPWTLLRLNSTSADFAYLPKGQELSVKTRVVESQAPTSLSEVQGYFEPSMTMASPAVTSVAVPSGRPPLPPELMRPAVQR